MSVKKSQKACWEAAFFPSARINVKNTSSFRTHNTFLTWIDMLFPSVKTYYLYLHVFIVYLILPVTDSQTDGHSEILEKSCSLIGLFICRFWLSLGKYNKEKSRRSKFKCRCFHKLSALVLSFHMGMHLFSCLLTWP